MKFKFKIITALILISIILTSSVFVYAYYKKSYDYTGYFLLNGGDINILFSFEGETGDLSEYIKSYGTDGNDYLVTLDIHNDSSINNIKKFNANIRYVGGMQVAIRVKISYYWMELALTGTVFPRMNNSNILNYNSGNFTKVAENGNAENTAEIYYYYNLINETKSYNIAGVPYTADYQNYTNIINGVNIFDVYPENYRLILKFEFENVQYNRANYLWAIDSLE
jgi:uncharacterized protein YxeA